MAAKGKIFIQKCIKKLKTVLHFILSTIFNLTKALLYSIFIVDMNNLFSPSLSNTLFPTNLRTIKAFCILWLHVNVYIPSFALLFFTTIMSPSPNGTSRDCLEINSSYMGYFFFWNSTFTISKKLFFLVAFWF